MEAEFQSQLKARVACEQAVNGVPALSVVVGTGGVPVAEASVGFADIESRLPPSGESCFRIGSITKTFTAVLVLELCEKGELNLDTAIGKYLPDTSFGHIPLRMLLSHSSGLQREVPGDMWESMQGPSARELLDAFGRVEFVAQPGQRWHYSNLGFAVLGQIIERVTGQSYETAIERNILEPLDLVDTQWSSPANAVVGYRRDPYADTVHREPVMDQGAVGVGGQLWSTPKNLLRWGYALCGGEPDVVSPAITDAMHTLQIMVDTRTWKRGWGLGLILDRHGDRVLGGHTGALPGFQAALCIDRDSSTVVVALTNATRGIALADLAAEIALDVITARPAQPALVWQPAPPCPKDLQDLLGSWWSESDETVFQWHHDGLHAHLAASPATTDTHFTHEAPGRFRADSGRLQGELLLVSRSASGLEMRWATYPLTRTPR
ncbi:serine hydrolase domain-containing protein [Nocardia wallacei]|uniref:serine hydrolase domain-containing protein n=1 Tax=Nocardia wallacei TaxID=480035 RepID=UPI0024577961|nr:serine hydrolase domain-containing protein [Nocardia wallacei]